MRLIDADALREVMYHEAFEKDTDMQRWDSGCWIRYKMFENAIDAAPTIEADPVKHGHWIHANQYPYVLCSQCGNQEDGYDVSDWLFCPNCGSRMDEEATE